MKHKNIFKVIVSVLFAIALFSCSQLTELMSTPQESNKVKVTLSNTGSRTVLPVAQIAEYRLFGTIAGGTEAKLGTYTDLTTAELNLEKGKWSFTLKAYKNTADADNAQIFIGTISDKVLADTPVTLAFTLAHTSTGVGSISITVNWPESMSKDVLIEKTLKTYPAGVVVVDTDTNDYLGTASTKTVDYTDIALGNYIFQMDITPDNTAAAFNYIKLTEIVVVKANMESSKVITLTEADFIDYVAEYLRAGFDQNSSVVYGSSETSSTITDNFTLPVAATYKEKAITIVWSEVTDTSNNVSIGTNGVVTVIQSASDKTVRLKAVASSEDLTATKEFDFTIKLTTKGFVSGIASYKFMDDSASGVEVGAVLGLSESIDSTSFIDSSITDSTGLYKLEAEPGEYYLWKKTIGFSKEVPAGKSPDFWDNGVLSSTELTSLGNSIVLKYTKIFGDAIPIQHHLITTVITVPAAAETLTINFTLEGY